MPDQTRIDLMKYRISKAKNEVHYASLLLAEGGYTQANNRAYYAMFHAVRGLLALEGVDFAKHSGVIGYFREHYVKTGIFDSTMSDIIGTASDTRNHSDYGDFYVPSPDETKKLVNNASRFVNAICEYLDYNDCRGN